jgi:glycosyltransferase involved in cell wall biosynthesis
LEKGERVPSGKTFAWLEEFVWPLGTGSAPITRGMMLVRELDRRLRQRFDLGTAEGLWSYVCWWLHEGRLEYPGIPFGIEGPLKAYLGQPADDIEQDLPIPITRGVLAAWTGRPALRQTLDPETRQGRLGLLDWWLRSGQEECDFVRIEDSVKETMLRPAADVVQDQSEPIPVALYCLWLVVEPLRQKHDINDGEGRSGLLTWWRDHGKTFLPWCFDTPGEMDGRNLDEGAPGDINHVASPDRPVTRPTRLGRFEPYGVNLVGFATGEFGLGEDVRMAALALSSARVPFCVYDVPLYCFARTQDVRLRDVITPEPVYATNILCLPGMHALQMLVRYGTGVFENRFCIGAWPWELPRWPETLDDAFRLVDEIWASSSFTAQAYEDSTKVPVHHMPMVVDVGSVPVASRREFGLPEASYLFLFVFDGLSSVHRKNPLGVVEAFRRAFPRNITDVGLVVKAMNASADNPVWRTICEAAEQDPRIIIFNETFSRDRVLALFNCCDAYVSLHRAEGFGRTIAEAMLLGKPVIVTNHSGNVDFCTSQTALLVDGPMVAVNPGDYHFGVGQPWCDPDIDQAAYYMRCCREDSPLVREIAQRGKEFVRREYGAEAVGLKYRKRLEALHLVNGLVDR